MATVKRTSYDIAIVGAGILGLAHAWAAAERGKRVVVIDRDPMALGASIRNFGFVTVTGQQSGSCWRLARRSRDVWAQLADEPAYRSCSADLSSRRSALKPSMSLMRSWRPRWAPVA